MILSAVLFLFVRPSSAGTFTKPELRLRELYRYEYRRNRDHALYTNRLSLSSSWLDNEENALFKLTPFIEIRRNTHKGLWERKEFGLEIGKDCLDWLYLGESIKHVRAKEDYRYYTDYENRDCTETQTRILLTHNLISTDFIKVKGFILDEFTYLCDKGKGISNEATLGVIVPLNKYLEAQIDWRHIDRIDYYDSDTFEAALTLIF